MAEKTGFKGVFARGLKMNETEKYKNSIIRWVKNPDNIKDTAFLRRSGSSYYYMVTYLKPVTTPLGQVFEDVNVCVRDDGSVLSLPRKK